jgi:hypothetical protein
MKFDTKSSTIDDDMDEYKVDTNRKQDHEEYEEHERNQHHQNSIVQTDHVNDKQTNQAHAV